MLDAAVSSAASGVEALAMAAKALRDAKAAKIAVPARTTSAELDEALAEARKALGLALERDGIHDSDARHFVVAIAAALAVQELTTRRWEECLSLAVVELRRGISPEDVQAVRDTVAKAAVAAMPTGEERRLFVAQIIEAVKGSLPVPEKLDLKAIEKAAEAGALRGARLRQEGENAGRKPSLIERLFSYPSSFVWFAIGTFVTATLMRML